MSIRSLTVKETEKFDAKMSELNRVLVDEALLYEKWDEFIHKQKRSRLGAYLMLSRYPMAIWNRMPALDRVFPLAQRLKAFNYIQCESHLDVIRSCMKSFLK